VDEGELLDGGVPGELAASIAVEWPVSSARSALFGGEARA